MNITLIVLGVLLLIVLGAGAWGLVAALLINTVSRRRTIGADAAIGVVTSATGTTARVSLPVIAKTGSANAMGGGFRINNTDTNESVRCSNPTIDTRARVVDCVLADGSNLELFEIASIRSRTLATGACSTS